MLPTHKNRAITFFCIVLAFLLVGLSSYNLWHHVFWYDSFYHQLHVQEVKHYRLLFIWVKGGISPELRPIGGNEVMFKKWQEHTEDFLHRAQTYQKKYPARTFVEVEIIVDMPTYNKHKEIFLQWKKTYGPHIKVTFLRDIKEKYTEIQPIVDQCTMGNPALCSDILRLWHIHSAADMNVYMDIDLFVNMQDIAYRQTSAKSFGMYAPLHDVSVNYFILEKNKYINNDLIIDRQYEKWDEIKKLAVDNCKKYTSFLTNLVHRHQWIEYPATYTIRERVKYYKENKDMNFHPINTLASINGPYFMRDLFLDGIIKKYPFKSIMGTTSWIPKSQCFTTVNGRMNYSILLKNMSDEQATRVLTLILLADDYKFLQSYHSPLSHKLALRIQKLWQSFTQEQQESLGKALMTPICWVENIASGRQNK